MYRAAAAQLQAFLAELPELAEEEAVLGRLLLGGPELEGRSPAEVRQPPG